MDPRDEIIDPRLNTLDQKLDSQNLTENNRTH